MSLFSQTSRDRVAIERLAAAANATGGVERTFSTANRGLLPTSALCRIQPLLAQESLRYGIRGTRRAWKLLFHADPAITVADRVRFELQGATHVARVVQPSSDLDGQARLYRAVVEETDDEQ